MRSVTITFDIAWSDRKVSQMRGDLLRDVLRQGGKNPTFEITGAEAEVRRVLVLECGSCWKPGRPKKGTTRAHYRFESEQFIPCPKCGGRETVQKIEAREEEIAA